jgi:hypothetical protein
LENLGDDSPADEVSCCASKANKHKAFILSHAEDADDSPSNRIMCRVQRCLKWLVVLIGISDFCLAIQDSFNILRRRMKTEYLFQHKIYNWYLLPHLLILILSTFCRRVFTF